MTIEMIPLNKLRPSKANPRKAFDETSIEGLAASIHKDGLLQNLIAAKPKGRKRTFEIISGERRYRALSLLVERGDLPADLNVPVEVRSGLSEQDALRIATIENLQRENLNPIDEARALNTLLECSHDLATITAQTGLSASTIKRRLALLRLCDEAVTALEHGDLSLGQAEALSITTHTRQHDMLEQIENGWITTPKDIRDTLTEMLPCLSDAIFSPELYEGEWVRDLLGEEDTTFFCDVEQFYALQKAAAEDLTARLDHDNDWAELHEGVFAPWEYNKAEEGESGGVVVELADNGKVEIHDGLIRKNLDADLSQTLNPKNKSAYSKALIEYAAMQKSAALQASLLEQPRTAKELNAARRLIELRSDVHACLVYLDQNDPNAPALQAINKAAGEILSAIIPDCGKVTWRDLVIAFSHTEAAYDAIKSLSDEKLEQLCSLIGILEFGQTFTDKLCTYEKDIFNVVASDIKADMRRWWVPDHWFLSRRTMSQLAAIIKDAGMTRLYGNGNGYKKSELVQSMARYFAKLRMMKALKADQQCTADWLPGLMHFPAIEESTPQEECQQDKQAA